ncbi:hypothetical protein EKO27_g10987 [Xylaria grammica]|uniref:Translation initiation factor IF-2, mitochondrial n=1 Tax=Xylaria grammica TaxID=363999 RepID=A0A439CPN1_9PEZI|nr:hypothetical protein EKO27_g10987 [Xylaria grammica]
MSHIVPCYAPSCTNTDALLVSQRDISICAICQYRTSLSLRTPRLSQNRPLSVTAQCASNHDPNGARSLRSPPSLAAAPSSVAASPHTQSLSRTINPKLQRSLSSYGTAVAPQPSANNAGPSTSGIGPVGRPKLSFKIRRAGDDIVDPHEAMARERLRAQQAANASAQQPRQFVSRRAGSGIMDPHEAMARERLRAQQDANANVQQPRQPQQGSIDTRSKARYVSNSPREQAIERYLRAEPHMHGDVSALKRRPRTKPALSLSGSDIGSNFSIRSEFDTKSAADRASEIGSNFFRRIGHRGEPPLRKVPASPVPENPRARNIDLPPPPPPFRPQPSIGQNSGSQDFVASSLSSLTGSGAFWHRNADNVRKTDPSPLKNTEDKRHETSSPFPGLGGSLADSAPRKPNTAAAWSGGLDALEDAGARDAEIKASYQSGSRGVGMSEEWGQLARKSVGKWTLGDGLRNTGQGNAATPRPERANSQSTEHLSPDPWAITKNDTAFGGRDSANRDSPFPQVPRQNEGNDRGNTGGRDPFEREPKANNKRDGRRSQKTSRFHDEDGGSSYDQYQDKRRQKELRKAQREAERPELIPIILPELISITAFANALKIKPEEFLNQLGELGFEGVTLDSLMTGETAALVAQEYGYEPTVDAGDSQDLRPRPPPEDPSVLPSRPPVVTIMGHVDHGKTTILDYLRQSSVAAQEHGGITQHIGAFSVKLSSGKPITFLDTPGHAAFLTMRQRGANVTDIVVLVVAADDSVKPQTLEALKHAWAAKVPIIVAINKVDKDGARIDAVKHDLATAGVEIEDFGGDVQVVCVSGKTGQGMDDLEENILTLSEILDHRAELDGAAEGWVLESTLKPTGKVATVLVKRGTLRPGDYIAAGLTYAKIRQLRNEAGVDIDEAPPGTPVEIVGWKDLPAAGDQVIQSPNEDKAKTAVSYRERLREQEKDATEYEAITETRKALQEKRAREKMTNQGSVGGNSGTGVQEILPEEEDGTKLVNFVVKGDVHGSVEAVCAAIQEIGNHEVRPRVLRSGTGPISKYDVEHAATSKSVLVNFATTTPGHVRRLAEEQRVRILDHTVIYHLIDDVKARLSEYLAEDVSTRVLGEAEILQIFPINLRGRVYKNIAGCRIRNGVVSKNHLYRITRGGEVIFTGESTKPFSLLLIATSSHLLPFSCPPASHPTVIISSLYRRSHETNLFLNLGKLETLKNVKKDVTEMRKGSDCGMGFEEFQDLEVGDRIQAYEEVRISRSL